MGKTFDELTDILNGWNRDRNSTNNFGRPRGGDGCRGIIRGKPDDESQLSDRTITLDDCGGTKRSISVGAVLDSATENNKARLPTVLCVGINYGQGSDYLKKSVGLSDDTKMIPNLGSAIALLNANQEDWGTLVLPKDFHLVAANVFPWISQSEWTELDLNRIEEALLIYLFGHSNVVCAIGKLWEQTEPTVVVFHGARSSVAIFGTSVLQAYPDIREKSEVIFTDNLGRRVTRNAVRLRSATIRSTLTKSDSGE